MIVAENFQVRRGNKKWLYFLALLLLIANSFLFRGVWRLYQKSQIASNNYLSAKERLDKLEVRKNFLQGQLAELKTEQGLEKQIRNSFSVVKAGEKMVVIVDSPDQATTSIDKGNPLWRAIKSIFGR